MVYIWVQTLVGFLVHFSRVQEMDGDQMELLVNGLWPFSGAGWLWRPLSSGMTPVISLTLVERECCCSKKHMEGWLWPGLLYMPHCKKKKKKKKVVLEYFVWLILFNEISGMWVADGACSGVPGPVLFPSACHWCVTLDLCSNLLSPCSVLSNPIGIIKSPLCFQVTLRGK